MKWHRIPWALIVAGLAVITAMPASAQWRQGPGYYFWGKEIPQTEVEKRVGEVLSGATKQAAWISPRGIRHFPIVSKGQVVGNLWEDIDLKEVKVGVYWAGPRGTRVELVKDTRVVGMLWLGD
jgi:hypothetical protein